MEIEGFIINLTPYEDGHATILIRLGLMEEEQYSINNKTLYRKIIRKIFPTTTYYNPSSFMGQTKVKQVVELKNILPYKKKLRFEVEQSSLKNITSTNWQKIIVEDIEKQITKNNIKIPLVYEKDKVKYIKNEEDFKIETVIDLGNTDTAISIYFNLLIDETEITFLPTSVMNQSVPLTKHYHPTHPGVIVDSFWKTISKDLPKITETIKKSQTIHLDKEDIKRLSSYIEALSSKSMAKKVIDEWEWRLSEGKPNTIFNLSKVISEISGTTYSNKLKSLAGEIIYEG